MEKKDDLNRQIKDLQKRRACVEDKFNSTKQLIKETDEEVTLEQNEYFRRANEVTMMKPDAKLLDLYAEREKIFNDMRKKQLELYDEVDAEYRKQMKAIDEQEHEIKLKILAKENQPKDKKGESNDKFNYSS